MSRAQWRRIFVLGAAACVTCSLQATPRAKAFSATSGRMNGVKGFSNFDLGRTKGPFLQVSMDSDDAEMDEKESTEAPLLSGSERNVALLYAADPNDHRYSASDWLHNMRSLRRSTILREIKGPILTITLWSTIVSVLYKLFLSIGWTSVANRMCISSKPHSFLVSALGLLLVFRTNSAYQRFAEGRIIWEQILSVSRNISRLAILYENEFGVARCRRFFRLLAAFPYLLHHHIQPVCDSSIQDQEGGLALTRSQPTVRRRRPPSEMLTRFFNDDKPTSESMNDSCWVDRRNVPWSLLPDSALKMCATSSNRPLWVCDRLSKEVNDVAYTPNFTSRERLTFLSHIGKLSQCIGQCERIHQTAVPLNYARHSLRSLTLWLFTLPFALIQDFGWLTGPVMGLAAWLLYGIYQIGYTIEDPFQGSLRLSTLCDAIYRDVMMGTDVMRQRMTAFSPTEREEWDELEKKGGLLQVDTSSVPRP